MNKFDAWRHIIAATGLLAFAALATMTLSGVAGISGWAARCYMTAIWFLLVLIVESQAFELVDTLQLRSARRREEACR